MKYIYYSKPKQKIYFETNEKNNKIKYSCKKVDDDFIPFFYKGRLRNKNDFNFKDNLPYTSNDDLDKIVNEKIKEKYSVEEEIKLNRKINFINLGKFTGTEEEKNTVEETF